MNNLKDIPLTSEPGSATDNLTAGWRNMKPEIDKELCTGCATCERVCPEGICYSTGKRNSNGKIYFDRDLDYCKGCALCAVECPAKAIKMMPEEK